MAFERDKDGGPKLKRDEHNALDKEHAKEVTEELVTKFLGEHERFKKDQSMNFAKTGKRDVVVHIALTVLPRVDGITIAGEREKEYGQWCFVLPAKELPCSNATAIKALSELSHIVKQSMMKLGMLWG